MDRDRVFTRHQENLHKNLFRNSGKDSEQINESRETYLFLGGTNERQNNSHFTSLIFQDKPTLQVVCKTDIQSRYAIGKKREEMRSGVPEKKGDT